MGVITEALRLLVEADTKGAVREVEHLGDVSDRELSRSKTTLDKWGNGLTKAGAGMIGFGAVAVAGLGHAAMAFEEAHLSEVKLENTLANMPKLAGENKQQFIDLAEAIQSKTAADADAIVEGEALLGTFQLTADQIKGITPLVVDYARKFGMDIPAASVQVGKALDGSIGALKRNGVSIDEALYKTDRYAAVQQALNEQVGGFAEQEGRTFAGSLQRLKNQLGDIEEGVGRGAVDAFTTMAGSVEFVTGKLTAMSPATQSTIGKVATFSAVGLIAAGGVSTLIGQLIKMRENFSAAASAIGDTAGKLGGLKGIAGIAAGAAGIAGLAVAIDAISGGAEKLTVDLDTLAASLDDTTEKGREALEQDVRRAASAGAVDDMVRKVADGNFTLAESLVDAIEQMDIEGVKIKDLRDIIAQKKDQEVKGAAAADEHAAAVRDGADAMGEEEDATKAAEDALKDYMDTLRGTFDPLFAMSDALDKNRQAHSDLTARQMEAIAAEAEMRKQIRLHGQDSDAAREATAAWMEAQEKLTDAQQGAREAVVDLQGAAATLKSEMDNNGLTAEKARQQFINMAVSMGYTQREAEDLAEDFGFTTQKAQELGGQRPTPRVNVTGDAATRRRLTAVKDTAHSIPTRRNTHASTTGTATAGSQLGRIISLASQVPRNINVNVSIGGATGAALGNLIAQLSGHREHGGPVAGGRLYEVAEGDRSELFESAGHTYFIPGSDGVVKPAENALLAGVGAPRGGVTHVHNYYINGSLLSERAITRDLNRLTRKHRGLN